MKHRNIVTKIFSFYQSYISEEVDDFYKCYYWIIYASTTEWPIHTCNIANIIRLNRNIKREHVLILFEINIITLRYSQLPCADRNVGRDSF